MIPKHSKWFTFKDENETVIEKSLIVSFNKREMFDRDNNACPYILLTCVKDGMNFLKECPYICFENRDKDYRKLCRILGV